MGGTALNVEEIGGKEEVVWVKGKGTEVMKGREESMDC